ncbi:MAG: hydroxymethylbilane synthase [Bacteroidetes bacterium]|nr:hydroxymethylbilane synthase [Bacteroidota bacterium]
MRLLKVGTRDSELAIWQAHHIIDLLEPYGIQAELELISSDGDKDLESPLYEIGIQGIFTKAIDAALLAGKVDIGVHSYKDVPTKLAEGLKIAAVPKRGESHDVLVHTDKDLQFDLEKELVIASSSSRRMAQWLNRYPNSRIESLRGNINTRLRKLQDKKDWDGAIFAFAGIDRIGLKVPFMKQLDWMVPAPAQGALVVVCREDDLHTIDVCAKIDDRATHICTDIERSFLKGVMGGCSTPAGGLAVMHDDEVHFHGNLLSPDGKEKTEIRKVIKAEDHSEAGLDAALEMLKNGGQEILDLLHAVEPQNNKN